MTAAESRRLLILVSAAVFADTMFYAVVAPLLPGFAHELHLSRFSAGLLTASYGLGTLVGSLPGGVLAARAGPRVALAAGLALLALASLAFGFAGSALTLDLARFVQGIGGACSWAGGLTWIVAAAEPGRRGELIGTALGAAIAGSVLGPAVGALAHAVGRRPVFGSVVVIAALLIWEASRVAAPTLTDRQRLRDIGAPLRDRDVLAGMWLMAVPAAAAGLLSVLGPLRLGHLGAGAGAIAATFLLATAVEAVLSPVIGRLSDRTGRMLPLRGGLVAATVALLCFTLPHTAVLQAAVIVLITGAVGIFWAPAMAMLSDAADAARLSQAFAFALLNLAWAAGQVLGSAGGGALAKVAGDGGPPIVAAAACAATLVLRSPPAGAGSGAGWRSRQP